jgi:hypothetical protein
MVTRMVFLLFWIGSTSVAQAALSLRLNVEELADASETIVVGTVLSVEAQEGSMTRPTAIVTTLRVDEMVKGVSQNEIIVRQIARKYPDGRIVSYPGLPRFHKGEQVFLFLPGESSAGLASPVGFGQGVFRVMGRKQELSRSPIRNLYGNLGVFDRLQGKKVQGMAAKITGRSALKKEAPLTVGILRSLIQAHRGLTP